MTDRRWLFVIGPARHGTSLVAWLLNHHPDCVCMKDTHIVRAMSYIYQPPGFTIGRANRVAFADHEAVARGDKPKWRGCAPPYLLPRHMSHDAFVRETCEGIRRAAGDPPVFGDKAPAYCHMWKDLLRIFPEATIVRCTRGFDAALESWVRTSFIMPLAQGPDREAQCRGLMARERAAVADCPCVREVSLEALEASAEEEITALLNAVGLPVETYDMKRAVQQVVAPVRKADNTPCR